MGVVPAMKLDFCISFLTKALIDQPDGSIAVIVHPNRAGQHDLGRRNSGNFAKTESDEESDDASDDDGMDPDIELANVMHDIMTRFSQKARGLKVRPITICYDASSVYGRREGTCHGILVTSASSDQNIFWDSPLWRTKVATGAQMLSRDDMVKPVKRTRAGIPVGTHFTDAQERKQHHTGVSFVNTVLDNILPSKSTTFNFIDLHGYDSFPALTVLERNILHTASSIVCTICHTPEEGHCVSERISHAVHSAAKNGRLRVPGFPDFTPVVEELKSIHSRRVGAPSAQASSHYKVTVPMPDGSLRILDHHVDTWLGHPTFSAEMESLLQSHNEMYNPQGERSAASEELETHRPTKHARLELPDSAILTYQQLVDAHSKTCVSQLCMPLHHNHIVPSCVLSCHCATL